MPEIVVPEAQRRPGSLSNSREMDFSRLLIAENRPNMRRAIRTLLESMFESVLMVPNANSLIDVVCPLEPDLAIVDLPLSVNDKIDLIREVKARAPRVKVIVVSLHDEAVIVRDMMDAGASGFILKRSVATDLIPAVHDVLGGGRFISPDLGGAAGESPASAETS